MKIKNEKISFIIPAYNEEGNLKNLLDDLSNLGDNKNWDYEIIVANDNSKDSTGKIADKYSKKNSRIKVIHRKKGINGMGASLKDGTNKSSGKFVFWIMGDRSDDLNSVPKMLKKLQNGYDMVMGSRYMPGGSRGDLDIRKAVYGSSYTRICRMLFGIKVHDMTNAFRGFKREVYDSANLLSDDFAISPEFAIKSTKAGYKLGEVPITYFNRKAGRTNFKLFKMGIRYVSLFKYFVVSPKKVNSKNVKNAKKSKNSKK